MAWYEENSWATWAFAPRPTTIIVTVLVAFLLPILIHFLLYQAKSPSATPSFLVLGATGSGKTTLTTSFERGEHGQTHTSVAPLTVDVVLPTGVTAGSSQYRSENDFEAKRPKKFQLIDTPGHAKLRHFAYTTLRNLPSNLKGLIFVVDAADLSSTSGDGSSNGLREAASYLYDVLLELQKRYTQAKSSKTNTIEILIAANKMDLFTALPESMVQSSLEAEINRLRSTRSKGIATVGQASKGEGLESAATVDLDDEESDILGGDPDVKFNFSLMEDYGMSITSRGGSVTGEPGVYKWWEWIADLL